jgi:putative MATE family efflux protein
MSRDRDFYRDLLRIALPISLQSLIQSSLTSIDQLMIGQLGERSVAAVGLCGKPSYVLGNVLSAITAGTAIYASQLWGKKDTRNFGQVVATTLLYGGVPVLIATALCAGFPELTLSLFTKDAAVISLGAPFLRILSLTFVPSLLIYTLAALLRSTDRVKIPLYAGLMAIGTNTVVNYLLIFGSFGFPRLGVRGAAWATVTACTLECLALIFIAYRRRSPGALRLRGVVWLTADFFLRYSKTTLPIIGASLVWVLGDSMYSVVFARMSTTALAALVLSYPIQGLTMGFMGGLSTAACVSIGQLLGAGEHERVRIYARKFVVTAFVAAAILGLFVALASPFYLSMYRVSEAVRSSAVLLLVVYGLLFWMKVMNGTIGEGILRGGGDTRFWMFSNMFAMWGVGIPAGFLAAFYFGLPVHVVYLCVFTEELSKLALGLYRVRSRRWANNLVNEIPSKIELAVG